MSRTTRRDWILRSAGTAAAATFPSHLLILRGAENAPARRVTVGVMGLSRGLALAKTFSELPGVTVKYLADVDSARAASAADQLEKSTGKASQPIGDFRTILDDPEVDVLVCAAPNHWHAPATILACAAGKHVYVEKPCSHNPREGELAVQASRTHRRAVQMGSQRRSAVGFQQGVQKLRDGLIGRVYLARAWYSALRGSIGRGQMASPPPTLNYDLWQGPAPRTPYVDNRIPYNWHWFWHWGNGELGNNGIHTLDICRWGLGVDYPVRVVSSGGRYRYQDDQETPDTHTVGFEFANGSAITWEGLSCNRHDDNRFVTFYGESGSLEFDEAGGMKHYDEKDKLVKSEPGGRDDADHAGNLVAAIRNDQPLALNAEILEGHKSTLLCHLGNIAHRTGRTLNCRAEDGSIVGDDEAMTYWQRKYEPGWEPKI